MNNSFARLIDGMCATLRGEVLSRLDDEFARGQVFGVINLLNTFKARADWSSAFLVAEIEAQRRAIDETRALVVTHGLPAVPDLPEVGAPSAPSAADLLAMRDEGNRAIEQLLAWLDTVVGGLSAPVRGELEATLRRGMRAEVDIELKHSPRPLFAEMSSGREG